MIIGDAFKRMADRLLTTYGTTNPFKLANYLNIEVVFVDFNSYLGLYSDIDGSKIIVINNSLPEIAQKIVGRHELAHSFQPFKESVFMKEKFLFESSKIETEANIFAAALTFSDSIDVSELTDTDRMLLNNLRKYYLY